MAQKYLKKSENQKDLTPQQRRDWNAYVDWLEKKGLKGSKELDKGETSFKHLDDFIKENPTTTISRDIIKDVQMEVQALADNVRDFARRKNNPNAENLMTGTSKFDGIPGSKTTSFKFPVMIEETYHNDNLKERNNLGLIGGDMKPSMVTTARPQLPKGAKLEQLQDGVYYEDPKTGDMVKYK